MTSTHVPVESEFQRLVVEQALALAREMESAAGAAPSGRILDRCEGVLLTRGRDFLRNVLQGMVQHTADEVVKKGGLEVAIAATAGGTKEPSREPW